MFVTTIKNKKQYAEKCHGREKKSKCFYIMMIRKKKKKAKILFHKYSFLMKKNTSTDTCVLTARILTLKVCIVQAFYFLLPINRESIVFGSNFRNRDFDGFILFEVH